MQKIKILNIYYIVMWWVISMPPEVNSAILSGKITDQSNGVPVAGVAIWLEDTDFSTISDAAGEYKIENIPDGYYTIIIDAPNFRQKVYRELGLGIYDDIDNTPAPSLPGQFQVDQNYPNPFNPATTITYSLPHATLVSFTIFDNLGRQVYNLPENRQPAGIHTIRWYALTSEGIKLPSGVYFYRVQAGSWRETKKMILIQ